MSSSGVPHLFKPTSICRQVKAPSCLAVQLFSTEQVAPAEELIQLQTQMDKYFLARKLQEKKKKDELQ